jgi:hypothetical protein
MGKGHWDSVWAFSAIDRYKVMQLRAATTNPKNSNNKTRNKQDECHMTSRCSSDNLMYVLFIFSTRASS